MRRGYALTMGLGLMLFIIPPRVVLADYFDDFSDGWWVRDPNDSRYDANDPYWTDPNNAVWWDADNPDWETFLLVGAFPLAQIINDSVAHNALRLACDESVLYPGVGEAVAGVKPVNPEDKDPNVSPMWWDDTTDHYVLVWAYYTDYYDRSRCDGFYDPNYDPNDPNIAYDPNDDRGKAIILMNVDDANWSFLICSLDFDAQTGTNPNDEYAHSYHANLQSLAFWRHDEPPWNSPVWVFRRIWIEPNDPAWADYPNLPYGDASGCPHIRPANEQENPYNGPDFGGENIDDWERSGFWFLCQFRQDPNYETGDPNGKWLASAIWHGGKFDWDGKYILQGEFSSLWASGTAGRDPGIDWYWPSGRVFVGAVSDSEWSNGFPADVAYDNIEARTGIFTNVGRKLTLKMKDCCDLDVDPDILDDPNEDPNDLGGPRRYTNGTSIVLSAVVPYGNKSFKKWTIKGPNESDDPNYLVVTDTNEVVYLTMDGDYLVKATCKCGGGGIEPFAATVLVVLGLSVAIRRAL